MRFDASRLFIVGLCEVVIQYVDKSNMIEALQDNITRLIRGMQAEILGNDLSN